MRRNRANSKTCVTAVLIKTGGVGSSINTHQWHRIGNPQIDPYERAPLICDKFVITIGEKGQHFEINSTGAIGWPGGQEKDREKRIKEKKNLYVSCIFYTKFKSSNSRLKYKL